MICEDCGKETPLTYRSRDLGKRSVCAACTKEYKRVVYTPSFRYANLLTRKGFHRNEIVIWDFEKLRGKRIDILYIYDPEHEFPPDKINHARQISKDVKFLTEDNLQDKVAS